ncbi:hypothetical protein TREMEDRAFT_67767 [Tremella mesenterica DSM 1558]|uniref:uncharacterized protein n=1 Tax=Tremella mesenterica (strain ATCC 24925 / CBS 8224 / DSM 1558 / NBRC 9311 / NRRL Y-6157 / RJB 2259-6 / UBC 559-6) TaxID=578456 RepID=UPI0003F48D34|nr:uncharacterized protein TREMEDRAFT_67767 [Tremella mesenterica DSM 1558]EIW71440.1 hypothetical protein TREMEDRAFT_67767 [Tremella mesenterica DSM 1558]
MPPDTQARGGSSKDRDRGDKERHHHHHRHFKDKVGEYHIGAEIGKGSFATVYKGYHMKTKQPFAIKAVDRQKLHSPKLTDNLMSEINILKMLHHRNIVALEDCYKSDTHVYLVMEYCTGSDLSLYLKKRGRIPTLDFVPRPGSWLPTANASEDGKIFWPHPPTGALDERITRSFAGQIAQALKFLRQHHLIHRDLKPQNLLLAPASAADLAEGHPYGVPVLKVADFGFARFLPAATMADTLCGSPLYMAPEILRYEKYDAKADLWSVGAILYEVCVGRPPFKAVNYGELLKKVEQGNDRIRFPDEARNLTGDTDSLPPGGLPVSDDIKSLIRQLLKRNPVERMSFDDFFACSVWEGYMTDNEEETMSFDASTDSSAVNFESESSGSRIREMADSGERSQEGSKPFIGPQQLFSEEALGLQPAVVPGQNLTTSPVEASPSTMQPCQSFRPIRRTEPKYYLSDEVPTPEVSTIKPPAASSTTTVRADPRPISSISRRPSIRDAGSVEEPPLVTPTSATLTGGVFARQARISGAGTQAMTVATRPRHTTGKEELDMEDSVDKDYVVVEKQTVEINALADELDQVVKKPSFTAITRRPSSRTSVVTRPISAFKPSSSSPTTPNTLAPMSYSPPFALEGTPPFAIRPGTSLPTAARKSSSSALSRPSSIPHALNILPPPLQAYAAEVSHRFSTSPGSLQTGALARALTNTAIRLIGTGANTAATVIARAASRRRPNIVRVSGDIDAAEDAVLRSAEGVARKAYALFELADARLVMWQQLARPATPTPVGAGTITSGPFMQVSTPPFAASPRRKSSSSSLGSEVMMLRQQEAAAGDAVVLYCKALAFIVKGTNEIQAYWESRASAYGNYTASVELNEMVQWLRTRFNECFEKAEWAKARCAEDLPYIDRLVHDKAREVSRVAAIAEMQGEYSAAEVGYETSLWLLQALLDDVMYDPGKIRDEDKLGIEKLIYPIKLRLETLRKKMAEAR